MGTFRSQAVRRLFNSWWQTQSQSFYDYNVTKPLKSFRQFPLMSLVLLFSLVSQVHCKVSIQRSLLYEQQDGTTYQVLVIKSRLLRSLAVDKLRPSLRELDYEIPQFDFKQKVFLSCAPFFPFVFPGMKYDPAIDLVLRRY